jgi:hypothetical protein
MFFWTNFFNKNTPSCDNRLKYVLVYLAFTRLHDDFFDYDKGHTIQLNVTLKTLKMILWVNPT